MAIKRIIADYFYFLSIVGVCRKCLKNAQKIGGNAKNILRLAQSFPYELEDMSLISRTFYGVDFRYLILFDEIGEDLFEMSAQIVDYARLEPISGLREINVFQTSR